MIHHERWRLFTCSDCDPSMADDDDDAKQYDKPYQVALPMEDIDGYSMAAHDVSCPINTCPRCGSHLSLCSDTEVVMGYTPEFLASMQAAADRRAAAAEAAE